MFAWRCFVKYAHKYCTYYQWRKFHSKGKISEQIFISFPLSSSNIYKKRSTFPLFYTYLCIFLFIGTLKLPLPVFNYHMRTRLLHTQYERLLHTQHEFYTFAYLHWFHFWGFYSVISIHLFHKMPHKHNHPFTLLYHCNCYDNNFLVAVAVIYVAWKLIFRLKRTWQIAEKQNV